MGATIAPVRSGCSERGKTEQGPSPVDGPTIGVGTRMPWQGLRPTARMLVSLPPAFSRPTLDEKISEQVAI